MSFSRHREIYPSDGGAILLDHAPAHRLDEFPAGYSLTVCSPALPASASPTVSEYAVESSCRSTVFQRTANRVLTICVSRGGKRTGASFSITQLAEVCQQPLGGGGGGGRPTTPGAPNIDVIHTHQFTLHAQSGIYVHWKVPDVCDKYHFMWTDESPTSSATGYWTEELNAPETGGFAFLIRPAEVGRTYTFKVQGCKVFDIGSDLCSPFSADSSVKMPENTHSLREFLLLSNVPLGAGVRSLGAKVFSAGFRAMMRL